MLVVWVMAAALAGLVAASVAWRTWVFPAGIMAVAVVRVFVDKPLEGPVVWDLPAEIGGVTAGDLVALAAFAVGLGLVWRALRQGRRCGQAREAGRLGQQG
jgi:uncharacterized membrane protein YedE/YeeE